MGGSGGSGFHTSRSTDELRAEVQRDLAEARLQSDVSTVLTEQLAQINGRDTQLINDRLTEIEQCLGDNVLELDRLLFGGSVAKHTYVDGLSDVDALVVLKQDSIATDTPQALRAAIERALRVGLDMGDVANVRADFAVTVTYRDGTEIQLLPAIERQDTIAISDKTGEDWSFIRPKAFEQRLTAANSLLSGRLVPTVKLAKAVIDASLVEHDRPGGYHVEALAVDAFRGYEGPRDSRSMVTHFFERAADRIKRPLADVTAQSERIDEVFGPADSADRQRISSALGRIASRMRTATTAAEWQSLFG